MDIDTAELRRLVERAVAHFWATRRSQATRQRRRGTSDQGARAAVTGGVQMDGFTGGLASLIQEVGIPDAEIFKSKALELPGYFRPTKKWDMLIVADEKLVAVIEAKSQVGPSFGNNFNNRVEEAIGNAVDLWTAYREGAFDTSPRPWLGYLFLLEDCEKSQAAVSVAEPHFDVFEEFRGASYAKRYELLCRKLIRERHYEAAAFILSGKEGGANGAFSEPASDLRFEILARSLVAHAAAFASLREGR